MGDGRPQWDTAQNAWVVWDASAQRWIRLVPAKANSGIVSALAGLGALSLIVWAIQVVALIVRNQ